MIIFDLDGTLVDSAPEILAAMENAWRQVVPGAVFPRERFRIGPPLVDAIAALAPTMDMPGRDALALAFRAAYDASDFSATLPYPGIIDVLDALRASGAELGIATNKRLVPTTAILARHFPERFPRVACIDGVSPDDGTRPGSKAGMLSWLTRSASAAHVPAVMVGDAARGVAAARAAGVRVIAVTWGYEDEDTLRATHPDAVVGDAASLLAALVQPP